MVSQTRTRTPLRNTTGLVTKDARSSCSDVESKFLVLPASCLNCQIWYLLFLKWQIVAFFSKCYFPSWPPNAWKRQQKNIFECWALGQPESPKWSVWDCWRNRRLHCKLYGGVVDESCSGVERSKREHNPTCLTFLLLLPLLLLLLLPLLLLLLLLLLPPFSGTKPTVSWLLVDCLLQTSRELSSKQQEKLTFLKRDDLQSKTWQANVTSGCLGERYWGQLAACCKVLHSPA